jgi:coatomer subunit beta
MVNPDLKWFLYGMKDIIHDSAFLTLHFQCSNALRNDLLHPNEFIRGQTLRFLCKLKEADILEPLIPSVRACIVR